MDVFTISPRLPVEPLRISTTTKSSITLHKISKDTPPTNEPSKNTRKFSVMQTLTNNILGRSSQKNQKESYIEKGGIAKVRINGALFLNYNFITETNEPSKNTRRKSSITQNLRNSLLGSKLNDVETSKTPHIKDSSDDTKERGGFNVLNNDNLQIDGYILIIKEKGIINNFKVLNFLTNFVSYILNHIEEFYNRECTIMIGVYNSTNADFLNTWWKKKTNDSDEYNRIYLSTEGILDT